MTTITSANLRGLSRAEFIALVAGLMALNAIAIDVMLPALPYMGEALGVADENNRQFVLSFYLFGFGITQLAFGPLSDHYGRRKPLIVGMIIYLVAAFSGALAPNFATLLALRFVQGMGAAATRVIALSVVRDTFGGRAMAEVMALVFMVFMIIPVMAPGIGQIVLLTGPWWHIFIFMGLLAGSIGIWTFFRLPETLDEEDRRELTFRVVADGFRMVFTNRVAICYALAGTSLFGGLFGFINTSQQIYVEIYDLGPLFPLAFAAVAGVMSVSSFLNSRVVGKYGMRRITHFAVLSFVVISAVWWAISLFGTMPLALFLVLLASIMFMFGWSASNMNSLSMEPLGKVAGTAAAVFGFVQTSGGALLGMMIGQMYDGSVTTTAAGYVVMGLCALGLILIAEKGRLFGVGEQYREEPAKAAGSTEAKQEL